MDIKTKLGFFITGVAIVIIASMLFYGIAVNENTANEAKQGAQSAQIAANEAKLAANLATASSKNALRALCAIKSGYQTNLKDSVQYLKQHPDGAPALGISAAQIEQSIVKIRIQLHALKDVRCS